MNKKEIFREFISYINTNGMMTKFIKNIFNYENLFDYNYLFRMVDYDDKIIIDIYDNISDNRFNRYIFLFLKQEYDFNVLEEGNVFVNYICIPNISNPYNNLLKLAYLFKIDNSLMLEYAKTFLDNEFVNILKNIIK